jgi:iron complex transport system substrate-binding protein
MTFDPGRQIEPIGKDAAKARHHVGKVATALHALLTPVRRSRREPGSCRGWFPLTMAVAVFAATFAHAVEHPRVASINMCTDQLLLALADPGQILGLSPYARDSVRSWAADAARPYPLLSGGAEDVLMLRPDLVVTGRYTKRETRELLKDQGVRVVEFDTATTLEDAKRQIMHMGELLGQTGRAAAAIARLDAALSRARAAAVRTRLRVLPLSRRGWVAGGNSLISALLGATGLANAATELGFRVGGFVRLEQIVVTRPDLLLVERDYDVAEDQGVAFLLHPAIEALYPPDRRLVLPEKLTVCGGPMLADALDRLTTEVERVAH